MGVSNCALGVISFIGGGYQNLATSYGSFVGGGFGNKNTNSSYCYTTIGGGANNIICAGDCSTIGGGACNCIISPAYIGGTIAGGKSNVVSGTEATVMGGVSNTASGCYTSVSGRNNNVSGTGSFAVGRLNNVSGSFSSSMGYNNTISGLGSNILGINSQITSDRSTLFGTGGKAYIYNQLVHSTDYLAPTYEGTFQASEVNVTTQSTLASGATTLLSTNVLIPNGTNRAWNVMVSWSSVVTAITGTATGISVGDVITSIDYFAFKKILSVSSISTITPSPTSQLVTSPAQYTGAVLTYAVGGTQDLQITYTAPTFAGAGTVTIRVIGTLKLIEVAY
jgi:hypothetical protein